MTQHEGARRPIIAVPAMQSAKVNGLRFSGAAVASAVIDAVVRAGGEPVIIAPNAGATIWHHVDGLVLPGGSDIDPARYGQAADETYAGTDFAGQDDADARAIRQAEELGLPALLICRGMQLWNVERGGDMVQHWQTPDLGHVGTVHDVTLAADSLAARVLGDLGTRETDAQGNDLVRIQVSSYHHQAVGRIGGGLTVTGVAPDGAVEALEDASKRILAVQWHPEDRAHELEVDQRCFDWIVAEARERMRARESGSAVVPNKTPPPLLTKEEVMQSAVADGDVHIAVVAQLNLSDQNWETYELIKRFTTVTVETLRSLGATVSLVDVTDDATPNYEAIAQADGVCMLGGGDVDGALYGYDGPVANEYGKDPRSDERQLRMLRTAISQDQVMLAICRSSQLLNVACGGTLIPDLEPADLHRVTDGTGMFHDEEISLVAGTRVHEVFARERLTVRSGHHQAVAEPGMGLQIAARADDGVIEAVERIDNTWIVGVQWHPEDDDGAAADRLAIFNAFVSQARAKRALRAA